MHVTFVPPVLPMLKHRGQRIRESTFCIGHDKGSCGARHQLEVLQLHSCMKQTFTRTTSGTDDSFVCAVKRRFTLHLVHIDFIHVISFLVVVRFVKGKWISFCDKFCQLSHLFHDIVFGVDKTSALPPHGHQVKSRSVRTTNLFLC